MALNLAGEAAPAGFSLQHFMELVHGLRSQMASLHGHAAGLPGAPTNLNQLESLRARDFGGPDLHPPIDIGFRHANAGNGLNLQPEGMPSPPSPYSEPMHGALGGGSIHPPIDTNFHHYPGASPVGLPERGVHPLVRAARSALGGFS